MEWGCCKVICGAKLWDRPDWTRPVDNYVERGADKSCHQTKHTSLVN